MKIKDLPINERPREKAKRQGFNVLANNELLAIILGSGSKNVNVLQLATNLLSEVGGLEGLVNTNYYNFKKMYGIKEAKALMLASMNELFFRLIEIMNSPKEKKYISDLLQNYQYTFANLSQEHLILVVVNSSYQIIKEKILYIGTNNKLLISFRDICKEVYSSNAHSYYLIHTHPSYISEASELDKLSTKKLFDKSKNAGLRLINHYIVTPTSYIAIMDEK